MEKETLIDGNMLFSIGIFTILTGFLLIIIGIALSLRQESGSMQTHSNRTDTFGRETRNESPADAETPFHGSPPQKGPKSEIKTGGVIMLGPIPIIFGSDKESAKTATILAIILMLLSLLIFRASFF
ncbi:TIGR00304 family protein [Methanosarcina sp. MSH10X1]|uniref:TIGR00304 family membrane protein n=1 Tax=Methanosarcina sp. MSH10X1 TaxID=2507075 RepID=UPI000FFC7DE7|nr:TIGR00304 family protein [Methanosarcina sp. MSH10X1]RXA19578.1 TIGR00304 family protein [Methanosarcina sp. MSH10X1]